jgi:hypothetical protein
MPPMGLVVWSVEVQLERDSEPVGDGDIQDLLGCRGTLLSCMSCGTPAASWVMADTVHTGLSEAGIALC